MSHVLITGASGGVGVETARAFLQRGARVSMHYNSNCESLKPLLTKYPSTARAFQANVTNENDVRRLFEQAVSELGHVSSLIVVHGVWPEEDLMVRDLSLQRFKSTLDINLTGSFLFCREYMRGLTTAVAAEADLRDVSIVFVGSTAGKFGEALHADYSASKSALMYGFTLSLKNEIVKIHPRGRVNTVSPGWIRTPMAERAMNDPSLLFQALASSPLKKVSEPSDVANAIYFLASEDMSGNITGISLDVNGGMEGRLLNNAEDFKKVDKASKL
ncbi:NAD-P-binding protein [Chytriomyces sp. MP71]|nr:NAD-P-binding protein [Chytriomyces sp. MP71]